MRQKVAEAIEHAAVDYTTTMATTSEKKETKRFYFESVWAPPTTAKPIENGRKWIA